MIRCDTKSNYEMLDKLRLESSKYRELQQRIEKVIEYINSESPDAGVSGKHIKDILKGNDFYE